MKEKAKKMNRNTRDKKRMSRKETYAKYGIEFNGTYIKSPLGNIRELLKEGNDKTGKLVYTFSMLPGTAIFTLEIDGTTYEERGTCCCDCIGCYAKTGHYMQYSAERSLLINTYLVNHHIDFVKACISAQLEYIGRGEIRIHTLKCGMISRPGLIRSGSGHTPKSKSMKRFLTI